MKHAFLFENEDLTYVYKRRITDKNKALSKDYLDNVRFKGHAVKTVLNQVANLNNYLRTRMDLIADISTSVPFVTIPKTLDSIVNYISDLNEEFKEYNSKPKLLINLINGLNYGPDQLEIKIDLKEKVGSKFVVSIPGDLLGDHAFYIIIENIIRNNIKHNFEYIDSIVKNGDKFDFNISIEIEEVSYKINNFEYIKINLISDLSKIIKEKEKESTLKEVFQREDLIINKINKYIDSPILVENQLRSEAWGMLEKKIAAAYLRQIPYVEIDSFLIKDPNIDFYPPLIELSRDKDSYTYSIYLKKSRKALILIVNSEVEESDYNIIKEFPGFEFVSYKNTNLNKRELIKHYESEKYFLVFVGVSSGEIDEKLNEDNEDNRFLVNKNQRILFLSKADIKEANKLDMPERLFCFLYEKWCDLKDSAIPKIELLAQNTESYYYPLRYKDKTTKKITLAAHFKSLGEENEERLMYHPFRTYSTVTHIFEKLNSELEENYEIKKENEKEQIYYELVEASKTLIVVLDERIQSTISNMQIEEVTDSYGSVLKKMGVYVPEEEDFNLKKPLTIEAIEEFFDEKTNLSNSDLKKFVIIHIGLIEQMQEGTVKVTENTKKIRDSLERYKSLYLVLVSGRGVPTTLPDESLYMPISILNRYLIEELNKFALVNILFNLKPAK